MTPSAQLQATLDLLAEIDKTPRPADAVVSAYFRARRYIGSHDRGAIAATFYDVVRHHARLQWWIEKSRDSAEATEEAITPRQWLIAYLVLAQSKTFEIINTLFSGGKFAPMELEESEIKLIKKLATHTIHHPSMPEHVLAECPAWAAESLQQRFGKEFLREMTALLQVAPLDLRVNTMKTVRIVMMKALKKAGLKAQEGKLSPFCIRVEDRPSLTALPMLKEGLLEIQDEGSQLIAMLVDAKAGQRVADFCAGAGGKTLAIAAAMENKGRVFACDVMERRLKKSTERFRRAGLHNIEIRPLSGVSDPWIKRHKGEFDRVLVDAPCSGTGTWRRNPDSRWRVLGPNLEELVRLQADILTSSARLVKQGGRLIYATCSLLPEENEKQMEAFLAAHPDFFVVPYSEVLKDTPSAHKMFLMLTTARHETDGFFGAVLERKAAVAVT